MELADMKKMSAKEKVYLLEETILHGTPETLREVIKQGAPFDFCARAMGLACGYGGYEKVKIMREAGMHLGFEYTSSLKSKYGGAYVSGVGSVYPARYWLMLADMEYKVYIPTLCAYAKDYHYGLLPQIDVPLLPAEERAQIAQLLLEQGCPGLPFGQLLFYALLWNNAPLIQVLLQHGVALEMHSALTEPESALDRSEALETMLELAPETLFAVLTNFQKHLPAPMILTQKLFDQGNTPFADGKILQFVVEHTNVAKLKKTVLRELAVELQAANALEAMAAKGWIKTVKLCDEAIAYASDHGKAEALSWLLEYKNKTFDLEKDRKKAEKKQEKELNASANDPSELKKIWSFKKTPEGGLEITSYKGTETEVVIPAMIGKNPVTSIGEWAFSPEASRLKPEQKQARKGLRMVEVPSGVTSIGRCAFYQCGALESMVLPNSLLEIGDSAFFECLSLQAMVLPENLERVGGSAFSYCSNLADISFGNPQTKYGFDAFHKTRWLELQPAGCVYAGNAVVKYKGGGPFATEVEAEIIIREGTVSISDLVFVFLQKEVRHIYVPASVVEISSRNFQNKQWNNDFTYIPIHAPAGSYAETYAKENNIPFVAE